MTEISSVSNYSTLKNISASGSFVSSPQSFTSLEGGSSVEPNKRSFTNAEVSAAVLATALVATTIGGAVLHGKYKGLKGKTSDLEQKLGKAIASEKASVTKSQELESNLNSVRTEKDNLTEKAKDLEKRLTDSQKLETDLQTQNRQLEEQLQEILNTHSSDEDDITSLVNTLRKRLADAKLDYDVEKPHIVRRNRRTYNDLVDLPTHSGTTNRSEMQVLHIPEIESGNFEITLPMSEEVKISRPKSIDFTPEHNVKTTMSEDYADSVNWNNDKIARDLLQNFYDGHGQTLDGVKIKFVPTSDGKFRVRIEGKTTYTQDKAIIVGESSKRQNANAAGNYGEGIKMASLKLLRDCGAENVVIASDNWRLNYSLQKGNVTQKRVLTYSIDKTPEIYEGNFLEFETDNRELLESLRKTINRFYHSGNEHFKCPDFENELFGVKLLKKGEKGGLYLAGQRFEFNGDYDGLKELVLFIKEKPPVNVLDTSRDRTSLDKQDVKKLVNWLIKDSKRTTKEERLQLIKAFESRWTSASTESDAAGFLDDMLNAERWCTDRLHIKFPDEYVAYSWCDESIRQSVEANGYKVCNAYFSGLGMQTISDVYGEARKHTPVTPNDIQLKKMLILKDAITKLSETMKKLGFSDSEINTRIHLFDRTGPKEGLHRDALAEAIVENGVSHGFWLDCNYILEKPFGHVLETALHELSHKVGGDSTSAFSYKLTDVNAGVLNEVLNNPQLRKELRAMSALWDEVG